MCVVFHKCNYNQKQNLSATTHFNCLYQFLNKSRNLLEEEIHSGSTGCALRRKENTIACKTSVSVNFVLSSLVCPSLCCRQGLGGWSLRQLPSTALP